ncbi:hypothetical protein H4R20_002238 [Coemansia guatemalensis]|uniref:BZIP domain-containing protein n=1 Tax=Coemansia guatemalensis TaxID=2761395 RepID=A0A9W8LTS8_9FUNG|nr:hypothetical protein H4R20_002238 [Coemansia guatemalensis]
MAVTRKQKEQKEQQQSVHVSAAKKAGGVGADDDSETYIVRNEQRFDTDGMILGIKATQEEQFEAALGPFSAGLAGAYVLGHGSPGMGGLSPAWSASTASNNGDAGLMGSGTHGAMFPALAAAQLGGDMEDAATADAALDGWLQQFVNTDALGSAANDTSWSPSMPTSDTSPAVASAMETLSPEMLATILTSGSACPAVTAMLPDAASQLSMLAALPFPHVATPTDIAPQKTLSVAPVTPEPMADSPPPRKVRRQQQSPRRPKAASPHVSLVSSQGGENATSLPADRSPSSNRAEATASSASAKRGGGSSASPAVSQTLAPRRPLAPRQTQIDKTAQPPQKQQQCGAGSTKGASGTTTPPGLSVLAKIAQKQAPIAVRSPQCSAAEARRPSPQTPAASPPPSTKQTNTADSVAQKRQERLIKNRAAALLSRKRKRDYMTRLESEVEELRESNSAMAKRLAEMERRLGALAAERDRLAQAGTVSSSTNSGSESQQTAPETESNSGTAEPNATSSESGTSASEPPSKANGSDKSASPADSMDVDGEHAATMSHTDSASEAEYESDSDCGEPRLRPRVASAADAPEAKQQAGGTGKQRTAGALLMAPRLLIAAAPLRRDAGFPLAERVRRSISAFAHPHDEARAPASAPTNTSLARPMTIQESAGLRAWISRGLSAEPRAPEKQSSALSVVRDQGHSQDHPSQQDHFKDRSRPDHAMLYCPTMKHVLFSSVAQQVSESSTPTESRQPAAARVLDSRPTPPPVASLPAADDVDDYTPADLATYASPDAGREPSTARPPPDAAGLSAAIRPKLSLYSPVVSGASAAVPNILPPWEEFARLEAPDHSATAAKQKYLRIDVEVVGSKWVTADKFANGLY